MSTLVQFRMITLMYELFVFVYDTGTCFKNRIWIYLKSKRRAQSCSSLPLPICSFEKLIALAVGSRPIYELVEATIAMTMKERDLQSMEGLLLHTHQGSIFSSLQHHKQSKKLRFIVKVNWRDNAVMESIYSHSKTEIKLHYPLGNYA